MGHGGHRIPSSINGLKKSSLVQLPLSSDSAKNGSVQKSPMLLSIAFIEDASSSTHKLLEFVLDEAEVDNEDMGNDDGCGHRRSGVLSSMLRVECSNTVSKSNASFVFWSLQLLPLLKLFSNVGFGLRVVTRFLRDACQ